MAVETKWGVGLMAEEVRAEATGGGDKYHLADALAARSGAAGVGQLDALLLSPVEDVLIVRHSKHSLAAVGRNKGDRLLSHHEARR